MAVPFACRSRSAAVRRSLALIAVLSISACALRGAHQGQVASSSDDIVISHSDIARMHGVQTAWDVLLRRLPGRFGSNGGVPTYHAHRGPSPGNARPLLVLDGVKMSDWRDIITIPVASVEDIHLLGAISGGVLYGTDALACVIMVRTVPQS